MKKTILISSLFSVSSSLFAHGFIAGTPVKTDTGFKKIEEVQAGDTVIACNHVTCRPQIVLSDAKEIGNNPIYHVTNDQGESVFASASQRFHSPVRGWVAASLLGEGDMVNTIYGFARIDSVDRITNQPTYAFEVETDHDFYANTYLVHNWGDNNGGNGGNGGNCSGDSCGRGGDGGPGGSGGSSSDGGNGNGNGNGSGNGNGNGNGNGK